MIVWTIAFGTALSGLTTQVEPLTIEQALKIAEQNAYSLKIADSAVRKADATVREANSNRGPQVVVNANYTRFDKELSGSQGTIRPIDSKGANIQLSYPLDFGGALGRVVRSAKLLYFATQDSFQAELNTLRYGVRQAYFLVLQSQEQVRVTEEALKVSQERLTNLEAQFKEGQIARVDVLRGETQVSQSRADLLKAQNALDLAKNNLNNAMSRPIETPVAVAPVASPTPGELNDQSLADTALNNRYELRSIRNQNASFAELLRAAAAAHIPTVNLAVNNAYNFGQLGFGSAQSSTTGTLSISVNLWDSGRSRAQIDKYREDLKQTAFRYDQTALGVSLEVRQALANYRNAQARLEVATKQVASAEENLRLAILRSQNGEGINLELVDAQNQLTSAKAQKVTAQYDALTAYAQLQKAVGSDDLTKIPLEGRK